MGKGVRIEAGPRAILATFARAAAFGILRPTIALPLDFVRRFSAAMRIARHGVRRNSPPLVSATSASRFSVAASNRPNGDRPTPREDNARRYDRRRLGVVRDFRLSAQFGSGGLAQRFSSCRHAAPAQPYVPRVHRSVAETMRDTQADIRNFINRAIHLRFLPARQMRKRGSPELRRAEKADIGLFVGERKRAAIIHHKSEFLRKLMHDRLMRETLAQRADARPYIDDGLRVDILPGGSREYSARGGRLTIGLNDTQRPKLLLQWQKRGVARRRAIANWRAPKDEKSIAETARKRGQRPRKRGRNAPVFYADAHDQSVAARHRAQHARAPAFAKRAHAASKRFARRIATELHRQAQSPRRIAWSNFCAIALPASGLARMRKARTSSLPSVASSRVQNGAASRCRSSPRNHRAYRPSPRFPPRRDSHAASGHRSHFGLAARPRTARAISSLRARTIGLSVRVASR